MYLGTQSDWNKNDVITKSTDTVRKYHLRIVTFLGFSTGLDVCGPKITSLFCILVNPNSI